MIRIGVVIVTYNRLEMLRKTLYLLEKQTLSPAYVIVVNNNSNDGTFAFLEQWGNETSSYRRIIINKKVNDGGSGGFYTGLEAALHESAEWVWVSDDDAFPSQNALEMSAKYIKEEHNSEKNISAICSKVINNGSIDLDHRRTLKPHFLTIKNIKHSKEEYNQYEFDINAFSYVGVVLNVQKIREVGLPNKDYFIWFDDTEHSLRLSKAGKTVSVPNIIVYHDTKQENQEGGGKTYYGWRNKLDLYKRHFPKRYYSILK